MTRYIRASMIDALSDCQLRACVHQWPDMFEARGYMPQHVYPTAGMAIGTAAHASIAHLLTEKLETGNLGSVSDAVEVGKKEFAKEIAGGFQTDPLTRTVGDATDQIARITQTFSGLVGYKIMPKYVEQRFHSTWREGWLLTGRVDFVPESLDCLDTKTGRFNRSYLGQIGTYSMNLRSNGITPKRAGVLHIRRTGRDENPAHPQEFFYDIQMAERYASATIDRTIPVVEAFEESGSLLEFQMNSSSWACSAKSCAAFSFCPAARAKEVHIGKH